MIKMNMDIDSAMDSEILWNLFQDSPAQPTLLMLRRFRQDSPTAFLKALSILADGSRIEERREAYGETGLLDYFLEIQATAPEKGVRRECLRAIANACADTGKATGVYLSLFSSSVIC